jgi:ribosome-binding protein aMBF1 (putative translation factor)
MPKSKSAELRIKVIDQCLSDQNRKYSTEMIFQRCNEELERRDFIPITAMNSVRADMEQIERIYPGAEIESYREGRNMSQKDLASKMGKRESEISRWLTGRHNFTTNTLADISLALNEAIVVVPNEMQV